MRGNMHSDMTQYTYDMTRYVAAALNSSKLNFSIPMDFIAPETYKKALAIVENQQRTVKMVPSPTPVYYVLSQSQGKFKALSGALISKFEQLRDGKVPAGVPKKNNKQALFDLKNSMYRVEEVGQAAVCPCEANPYHLACRVCKSYAHDGICKHVLAITHIMMSTKGDKDPRCNLKFMTKPLSVRKKASRPRLPTPALVHQPEEADSSDDEEAEVPALLEGNWQ